MDKVVLTLRPRSGSARRGMVRDFIYGCWCNGRRIGGMEMPPLNEIYVATHARQPGVLVQFLDAQIQPERYTQLVAERFKKVAAVIIMSSTQSFKADSLTLRQIKSLNPGIKSIIFGSHPTFMPSYCLEEDVVDYIVIGEPEETIRKLVGLIVRGQDTSRLLGIGYRTLTGEKVLNAEAAFMNLDDLPIPDRSLLPQGVDYFNPVVKRMPYTTVQTSRGCPGRCIFCTAPVFYGKKARKKSAEYVLEELRLIKGLGYREVFFRDETFTAYRSRNQQICEAMIKEKLDLSWIANARVNMIDLETMALMKKAGCHMLKFGVETGSDKILTNYKKDTTAAQAQAAFSMARKVGMDTHAHIVFGGPGETPDTIENTIRFVIGLQPTTASFGILTPYPGTELFQMVATKHPEIRDGSDSNMDNLHVSGFFSMDICGLDGQFLSQKIVQAYRRFYLRPTYLLRRVFSMRSYGEFMRTLIAGTYVMKFAATGEK